MSQGTIDVEIVKDKVNLVATRADGAEMRFIIDEDFSDYLGRKLVKAAKTIEQAKAMSFTN